MYSAVSVLVFHSAQWYTYTEITIKSFHFLFEVPLCTVTVNVWTAITELL